MYCKITSLFFNSHVLYILSTDMAKEDPDKDRLTDAQLECLLRHWRSLKQNKRISQIIDELINNGTFHCENWWKQQLPRKPGIEKNEHYLLIIFVRTLFRPPYTKVLRVKYCGNLTFVKACVERRQL